jgi:dipeptide/tripeptide permease
VDAVAEVLENLAFLANASNLVTYLMNSMHYTPAQSATTVTNFMGTAFLLALLGGFLSDAVCTTYVVYLASAFVEFMVRTPKILLSLQSSTGRLPISVYEFASWWYYVFQCSVSRPFLFYLF